jgi:hypothetical protein
LKRDAKKLAGDPRPVLLCFTCDPYQPIESGLELTRRAIEILGENRMKIRVLTKNGALATRDFDLFKKYGVEFGQTIIWSRDSDRAIWEPRASSIDTRIGAAKSARELGIPTWISLEPVIHPGQALAVMDWIANDIDVWKIGKWNHDKSAAAIDWRKFLFDCLTRLENLPCGYYIKDALWAFADDEIRARWPKEREKK